MAAKIFLGNRARESVGTPGTGAFTLGGAISTHQSLSDAGLVSGQRIFYGAESSDGTQWEVGLGTYNGTTITRDTIYASSNAGLTVDFTGATQLWIDAPTQWLEENERSHTAAGDVTIEDTDDIIYVNKSSGAATGVALPAVADRSSKKPLTIVDAKGDAATNNITITPDGAETIMGLSSWVINQNYGSIKLRPYEDGSKWLPA